MQTYRQFTIYLLIKGNNMAKNDKVKEITEKFKKDRVEFVNLQFSDMMGQSKVVTIPSGKMPDVLEYGMWFDGSSIEGFTRIFESDMLLKPDLSTYAVIPWLNNNGENIARLICDVYTPEGKPYECDPRYILKKVMKEAEDMGFVYNTGPELEFFLFKKENGGLKTTSDRKIETHDRGQYFDLILDLGFDVRRDMMKALMLMGIDVEASHHEVAPGQHEIDFKYGHALRTADRVMTMKSTLKAVAQMHGIHATFMPKPITGVNGTGMHVHQSLFSLNGKTNLFFDRKDKATRLEIRCPDPSSNPYLAFAVLLKAGLDGIKKKMIAPKPVEEDVFEFDMAQLEKHGIEVLPYSLWHAVRAIQKNEVISSALGADFMKKYVRAKTEEWDDFRLQVTEWELDRYLET